MNHFLGELSADIGHSLPLNLTKLDISDNNFNGTIPASLSKLWNLRYLDVFNNNITDTFPTSLYLCGSLQYLSLSRNHFHGDLLADIGHSLPPNLSTFFISHNKFNGTIPASLLRRRNLLHLRFSDNLFVGTIPVELGELTSLRLLALRGNLFDAGELPVLFSKLTNLERLCVTVQPRRTLLEMRELEVLFLDNNSLTGSIPLGLWRLKKLEYLSMYVNNFTGNLVVDGFAAVRLKFIAFWNSKLAGTIPDFFGSPHMVGPLQQQLLRSSSTGAREALARLKSGLGQ
jgi:kinase